MTRSKRFVTGLLTSYVAIGVNILYTIASVPLALHYLNKAEFGLWALVTQLAGYLTLLDFGMRGSVARSLSDHKDYIEGGTYGNILKTGNRVFAIQGLCVALLGLAMAFFAASLLGLPTQLQHPFAILMAVQSVLAGFGISLGALGAPLWCHQRSDIYNFSSSMCMVTGFASLWLGFHLGWQIYSLILSSIISYLTGVVITYFACRRLKLYPSRQNRGHFDRSLFRELSHFGSGLFLMNIGTQLASASQVIVVSRLLGVEMATVWSISTRVIGIANQCVSRVFECSSGGLAEMFVRGESALLHKRFRDLVTISAVIAVTASAAVALTNGAFIEIWTSGRVAWEPWNNLLLAGVLFITGVTRCHTGFVGITKQIRGMKLIYLIEGIAFIALSVFLVPLMGLAGLLIATLICNIGITGIYGIYRTADYFNLSGLNVIGWTARPTGILLITAALFSVTRIPVLAGLDSASRILLGAASFLIVVIPAIWVLGINRMLRNEISHVSTALSIKILAGFKK